MLKPQKPVMPAHDVITGVSDDAIIRGLQSVNPPYIFGTNDIVAIGDRFSIGEYQFTVVH